MEIIGSLLFLLALTLIVVVFIARPFLRKEPAPGGAAPGQAEPALRQAEEDEREHQRSALLAERDRVLTALQDLDFDYVLGKVPQEDYPEQRAILLQSGADVLRKLDQIQPGQVSAAEAEDRIEAAVAARRADALQKTEGALPRPAGNGKGASGNGTLNVNGTLSEKDMLEDAIAARKRQRKETTGGFCPKCGRPVSKSDKFCSKCGTTL
jgi:hypothetical protein